MADTLLSMLQDVARECALPAPTSIVANTDTEAQRMLTLAKRTGTLLSRRPSTPWQVLVTIASFVTVATESQGAISTIAPGIDLSRFTQDALVNRTTKWMVGGPMTGPEWERMQAFPVYLFPRFRVINGDFHMLPVPAAGQSIYFEYASAYWVLGAGVTAQATFTGDTDTIRLDPTLFQLGVKWRLLAALGQPYAEAFREFENEYFNQVARDGGGAKQLDAGGAVYNPFPSAMVPESFTNLG